MATNTNRPRSLESRRAERRRRERRRKKRIRAVMLLILLIAVIVLIIIAFASCSGKKNETGQITGADISETVPPGDALPTESPSAASSYPSPENGNDLLDLITAADAQGGEKTCYLTFDDGPSENVTVSVLDTLRRYNVKATFFELGASITSNPDVARRVYEEGHLIANHSNGHNYETLYATPESFMNEVQMTEEAILTATGGDHPFKLFRFPGGSYNAGDHAAEKQEYKELLRVNGFFHIDWNSLTGDAEGKSKNAQELLEYLKNNINPNKSTVVLMHDAAAKTATAEALPLVIEYLMSEGYVFKRLDSLPTVTYSAPQGSSSPSGTDTYDNDYNSNYTDNYSNDYDDAGSSSDDYSDYSGSGSSGSSSGMNSSSGSGSGSPNNTSGGNVSGSILSSPAAGSTTRTSVNGTSVTE